MRSSTRATTVRLANLINCCRRKHALIFGASLIGTFLYKLTDYLPDDEEEQGDAKVKVETTAGGLVKFTREKIKKESDGSRQKASKEEAGEQSRSGAKDGNEHEDEAEVDDEAEDEYEQAEHGDEEEDEDDDDDDDDEEEEEDDEGEVHSIPEAIPEGAIFIPLGLVRQRRPSFYKGTDPEWQSFVEFSRDKKRSHVIRSMLLFFSY